MARSSIRFLYPFTLLITILTASGEPRTTEFLLESASTRAEVQLQFPANTVEVKVLDRDRLGLPDALQISLFDKKGKRRDLEVTAMPSDALSGDLASQRKYSGQIPAGYESYVGVSLKIPFTRSSKSTTLKTGPQ